MINCICPDLFLSSCANDSSQWVPLPANSTEITVESHIDENNHLESQVMFGHLESTLAVRCLARNDMATVSREVKLVSSGKKTNAHTLSIHPCSPSSSFPFIQNGRCYAFVTLLSLTSSDPLTLRRSECDRLCKRVCKRLS